MAATVAAALYALVTVQNKVTQEAGTTTSNVDECKGAAGAVSLGGAELSEHRGATFFNPCTPERAGRDS